MVGARKQAEITSVSRRGSMLSLQGFEDALQHAGWLRCGEYATKSPGGPVSILQLARVGEEGGHAARDLAADGAEAGVIERFRIGDCLLYTSPSPRDS